MNVITSDVYPAIVGMPYSLYTLPPDGNVEEYEAGKKLAIKDVENGTVPTETPGDSMDFMRGYIWGLMVSGYNG